MEITQRVGLYSIGVNVFLVSIKLGLAALTGSLALAADGIHSLVDVVASVIVLAGVFIAQRKNKAFPYGLYKVENVVTVVLALLIFLAGYEIAREAITAPVVELANGPLALSGTILAILVAYLFSRYEKRLGKETGSPSLVADSQHFRSDVLASGVVFAAIVGTLVGLPLDRLGAIVVVAFVIYAGWGLLLDGMRVLLDASLDHATMEQVERIVAADPNVIQTKSLVGRNAGRYKFIEADIVVRSHDLEQAHLISRRLETAIRQGIPRVERVLIHYEPEQKATLRLAMPLDESKQRVSPHFGDAPFFALIDLESTTGQVVSQRIVFNPYLGVDKQKGILVAEFLVGEDVDRVLTPEGLMGKGPSFVLSNANIEVLATDKETLDEVVSAIGNQGHASLHSG